MRNHARRPRQVWDEYDWLTWFVLLVLGVGAVVKLLGGG